MIPIVFIMGATCSGKSTFLDFCKKVLGNHVHTANIGGILRSRHDPDFFNGDAAPAHTAKEAWDIFEEEFYKGMETPGVDMIMFDGQPRRPEEVGNLYRYKSVLTDFRFVMFHASAEARKRRIDTRFPIPEGRVGMPGYVEDVKEFEKLARSRDLAEARLTKDTSQLFDVWGELSRRGEYVLSINTDKPATTYQHRVLDLLCGGLKDVR